MTLPPQDAIVQFTLLVSIGLAVQLLLERSRVPALVGLLVIGVLLGPEAAGIVPHSDVVELFGSLGLLYIMFAAGLEIDLDIVRDHKRQAAAFGFAAFALSFALVFAVAQLIGADMAGSLLLAAALSSHTLLSYPLIRKLGLVHRQPIVATVGGTLLTDTLSLVILVVVLQQSTGGSQGLSWSGPLLMLAALAVAAVVVLPRLARRTFDAEIAAPEKALFILATLLVLATIADAIGTEDILGAFLAGICLNRAVKQHDYLQEHLEFVGRMLFIPFFFIETGMRLDLGILIGGLDVWWDAALLLACVIIGKGAASYIIGSIFGYRPIERLTMIGLTIPQAAATLAVTITASEAGLIDDFFLDAVIIVIFLTCLAGPLLTRYAGRRLRDEEPRKERKGSSAKDNARGAERF